MATLASLLTSLAALGAAQDAARLERAVGAGRIEARTDGTEEFKPLAAGSGVSPGTWIRVSAGVRAAFELPDGIELRVNEETEFLWAETRKVELKRGRLYGRIAKGSAPFQVRTELAPVTCESGEVDVLHLPSPKAGIQPMTTVAVFEGMAEVRSRRYGQKVTAGLGCSVIGTQLNTPDPVAECALETDWVHPLLRERGRATPEVAWRVRDMLGRLAVQAKDDPYEPALRALGDLAVPALAEYLALPATPAEAARRAAAARIVGEAATLASAPALLRLLGHPEGAARAEAARALGRIAGKDLGFPEGYWRGDAVEEGRKAWEAWVKEHSGK